MKEDHTPSAHAAALARVEAAPWVRGPLELLRHAAGHERDGGDVDRRIALVGFDNAIEVSIDTYLRLHPRLRGGLEIPREDMTKHVRNYHSKMKFLEEHVAASGDADIRLQPNKIIWFHALRNELYHSGQGMVPELAVIAEASLCACEVFRALFGFDCSPLLSADNGSTDRVTPGLGGWEIADQSAGRSEAQTSMDLIAVWISVEQALRAALAMAGISFSGVPSFQRLWTRATAHVETHQDVRDAINLLWKRRNELAHTGTINGSEAEAGRLALVGAQLAEELRTTGLSRLSKPLT